MMHHLHRLLFKLGPGSLPQVKTLLTGCQFPITLAAFSVCLHCWLVAASYSSSWLGRVCTSLAGYCHTFLHASVTAVPFCNMFSVMVDALTLFLKIVNNNQHPLHEVLPTQFQPICHTCQSLRLKVYSNHYFVQLTPSCTPHLVILGASIELVITFNDMRESPAHIYSLSLSLSELFFNFHTHS